MFLLYFSLLLKQCLFLLLCNIKCSCFKRHQHYSLIWNLCQTDDLICLMADNMSVFLCKMFYSYLWIMMTHWMCVWFTRILNKYKQFNWQKIMSKLFFQVCMLYISGVFCVEQGEPSCPIQFRNDVFHSTTSFCYMCKQGSITVQQIENSTLITNCAAN